MLIPERGRLRHGDRRFHRVALTFDDGPGPLTGPFVDALDAADAVATFFLVGSQIPGDEATVARAMAAGHELGCHSHSHPRLGGRPVRGLVEMARALRAMRAAGAPRPRAFRPPYGDTSRGLALAALAMRMRTVNWDVDTDDWEDNDPARIADRAIQGAKPGSIVVMHERDATLAALPAIVAGIRARGLEPVRVTELFSAPV